MGFCAGPFVLCKDGCCHQRRRNTNFGPENCFSRNNVPPHMCSQNDQRDILSHVCWGRPPPLPLPARQVGQPQPKPPSRHGDQGGEGGGLANGLPCHPPPPAKQFSSRPAENNKFRGLRGPMGPLNFSISVGPVEARQLETCNENTWHMCTQFIIPPSPKKQQPKSILRCLRNSMGRQFHHPPSPCPRTYPDE